MISTAQGKRTTLTGTQSLPDESGNILSRKVWLPKFLYASLPYFYVGAGFSAFLATVYISEWFWVLPHYLLFSVACVHLGVKVYRRRRRAPTDKA
jgi:hypothetical protein